MMSINNALDGDEYERGGAVDRGQSYFRRCLIGFYFLGLSVLSQAIPYRSDRGDKSDVEVREVRIAPVGLMGTLRVPRDAHAVVVFVHGSGSSRLSPRNRAVAERLNVDGFATLLFDLLTEEEASDRANVFDIRLLAQRLVDAVHWLDRDSHARGKKIGLFGASTGAAAALVAAAALGDRVSAVVSRGGRPDLAGDVLDQIRVPTLLIVGGADDIVIDLNEQALARLGGPKALEIIPGASHLFPEPGALEAVIGHATRWFARYLTAGPSSSEPASKRRAGRERMQ